MRIIDLSHTLRDKDPADPEGFRPEIRYVEHLEGMKQMRDFLGVSSSDLRVSGGLGWAIEHISMMSHSGTHIDAPWHYHPISEGRRARTISEAPLEYFYSDGVRLDFTWKEPGAKISSEDIAGELKRIGYSLKERDIVLIMTGYDKKIGTPQYFDNPGLTREAVLWLVDRGVRVIGIDAWSLDRSLRRQVEEYRRTGDPTVIWEAHFAGIEREYYQIEKLANLDALPKPFGFKVACFPVKIELASAAPARVVAIFED